MKQFDLAATVDLLSHITADADAILRAGPFAADHAYRALRILYREAWSASKKPPNHALIEEQIVRLGKLIYPIQDSNRSHKENYSPVLNSLDPDQFRDAMKQLHDAFAASRTHGATADAAR